MLQQSFLQEASEDDNELPGVPVAQIGSTLLEQAPLSLVHSVCLNGTSLIDSIALNSRIALQHSFAFFTHPFGQCFVTLLSSSFNCRLPPDFYTHAP